VNEKGTFLGCYENRRNLHKNHLERVSIHLTITGFGGIIEVKWGRLALPQKSDAKVGSNAI
jgi:hypothetical protein